MSEQQAVQAHGRTGSLLTNSSLRAKTLWALGITMGLFTATALAFLFNQQQVREARGWTDHTNEVLAATGDLLAQVLRQESNLRGYIVAPLLIVDATLNVGTAVIAETSLSYLGFGARPPDVSLGTIIADGTPSAGTFPWLFLPPVTALVLLILAATLIGDGLRDALGGPS